jgi:hypothetical protein
MRLPERKQTNASMSPGHRAARWIYLKPWEASDTTRWLLAFHRAVCRPGDHLVPARHQLE